MNPNKYPDSTRSWLIRSRRDRMTDGEEDHTCEEVFGLTKDKRERPLYYTNVLGQKTGTYDVSDNPDFSSLLQVGDSFYSIVQFEYPRPGTMYLTELEQNQEGYLSPLSM